MNKDDTKAIISKLLITYRTTNSLTQVELAELLDVSQVSISNYEAMAISASRKVVVKIARLFNASVEELFEKSAEILKLNAFHSIEPPVSLKKATLIQIFDELKSRNIVTHLTLN